MNPFSFTDFGGGITEEDIPGATDRYQTADNLLIEHDKKLRQRDGFDIYSATAYQLPAAERVARLANFDIDSEILAFQNKKAFAISAGAWAEVQGPGGGSSAQHAFNTNTAASLLEEAQWQHHLFASTDSGDPVVKMYRDSGGVMRLRTAGMPEFTSTPTPTDGGVALAITLINDLRTQMIAHYGANGATAGSPNNLTSGHHSTHADLTAQAAAVTASTAASGTGQAGTNTVIALLNILRTQYSGHISDAQKEDPGRAGFTFPAFRNYHAAPAAGGEAFCIYYDPATTLNQPTFQWRHYLNFSVADPNFTIAIGTAIANVLPYLNDLRDKWNWHTFATNTHFNAIKWKGVVRTKFGTHKTSVARVEPYTWAQITPNLGPLIQFLADLLTEYNSHISLSNGNHIALGDSKNVLDSSFPTTPANFWECIALFGGLADVFTHHALEVDPNFNPDGGPTSSFLSTTATSTSGSPNLSVAAGGTADQYKYWNCVPVLGTLSTPFTWVLPDVSGTPFATAHSNYKCSGSTNATPTVLTFPTNFATSQSAKQFLLTTAQQHWGIHPAQIFAPRVFAKQMGALDFTLGSAASLQEVADLVKSFAGYMKLHETSLYTKQTATSSVSTVKLNNNDFDVYFETGGTQALGQNLMVHYYIDEANFPGTMVFPQSPMLSASATWPQDRFSGTSQYFSLEARSFNYKALFRYDYTVGTKPFTDRGAPSAAINVIGFLNEDSGGKTETGKFAATLANVQVYANAANENYAHTDTSNFFKEIYRTLGDGENYYRVDVNDTGGSITNATTSLSDYSSDTYLFDQLELYTNDGSPENNSPPLATNVHVFGNVMYYVIGNKVYQSLQNDPDSVPSDFFEEFEENIIGVSSTRSVAVAFGKSRVYRLVGFFDELGRGGLTYERIFDRTGAISAQSIVKADNGIFFAGKDGFYFTDGYQCMRVTDLESTFRGYTDSSAKRAAIQGSYDNISKRVYFTMPTGNSAVPDKMWVLDLKFGIQPDRTPVTTFSKTTGFNPTALTYFNGQVYYGDGDGYVFAQTRGLNYDLVKDTGVAATSWAVEATQWDFKSCNHNYGSEQVRKYFQRITVQFDQQSTNLSATVVSDADKGRITGSLPVIRSRKLSDWGDSKLDWIASVYTAQPGKVIDEWRHFNGDGSLRSNYRAIEIKTAYCNIVASKDMGTSTVANVAGNVYTVTLTSLVATRKWPLYSVGYYYRLGGVDYPITVRTSDSVIRIDATGLSAPAAGLHATWEVWGYPKNERARLLGYTVKLDSADENEHSSKGTVATGGQNA